MKKVNMDMDQISPDHIVREPRGKDRWGFSESAKPKEPLRKERGRRYGVPWLDEWLERDRVHSGYHHRRMRGARTETIR